MRKKRIAILLSGRGSNFEAIYRAICEGKIDGEIGIVISNKENARGLQRAREFGLETLYLNPKEFSTREEYDLKLAEEIEKRDIDLICLAGWMRIITLPLIERFRNRIMNIHPALLPSFPGLEAQKQALEYGVRFSGCTVHFVTEEVDAGPIILQAVVPVFQNDTVETLSERILREEHKIYPEAIRLFIQGKLGIVGRRVIIKD
ncbi:MAG: phosphoribosylglycinamide formyltransferase [Candidatus Aminicenantia bacterium]